MTGHVSHYVRESNLTISAQVESYEHAVVRKHYFRLADRFPFGAAMILGTVADS